MDKDKFTFGLEVKMVPRYGLGRSRVSKSPALWIRRTGKVGVKEEIFEYQHVHKEGKWFSW